MTLKTKGNIFSRSLQFKLTTLFVLGVFIAVGIVGITSVKTLERNLEEEILDHQMLLAMSFGSQVEQYLEGAKGIVRITANLPAVKDMSYVPFIKEDIKGVPEEMDRPKRQIIQDIMEHYGQFGYMRQVTGDEGLSVVVEPFEYQLELDRLDFSFRDWFQNAATSKDTYVSEVYVSSSIDKPVIAISHPIMDVFGRVEAVWMGALTLDMLSEIATSLTFGETGHAYLVDQRGTLAAYKDFEMVQNMQDLAEAPAVQKVLQGESGTGLFLDPIERKELVTSYMPVGGTGWGIMVVQDPDEAFAPVKAAANRTLIICLVLMGVAAVMAWLIAHTIARPIRNLASIAGEVAAGDLTVNIAVESKDEVGALSSAFGQMVEQMRVIVREIAERANMVASSSQQLNAGSEETAANANEAAAIMGEMASTVEQVNVSINEVANQSRRATEFAGRGNEGMARIISQMQSIANSTNQVSTSIDDLNHKSREISQIVSLITDIADQTNLLALNAAIEAARAGEQGRGFAVVAEEVRKLAEESANAAQEIHALINAIQAESENAVEIMAEGAKEVDAGTVVVDEVRGNFQEITDSVQDVTSLVGQVVEATGQMTEGVQNTAASTEEQTAAMQEVSASAEALARLAEELNNLVGRFKA
ncbi:MAG: methyl-accepting chemotaxis protein [Firmicutes bacterium]|nr:methyl-accepting chemotaxis protein [Bacillota bacterium]